MVNPKHHDRDAFQMLHFSVLKLLLSAGSNVSSKEWLRDLFFNEDYHISPMTFHSQPHLQPT